jgi:hypothetical protein
VPYYVFKVHQSPIRRLERIGDFARFPEASRFAKESRARFATGEPCTVRVVFGETELAAEAALSELREPPPGTGDN